MRRNTAKNESPQDADDTALETVIQTFLQRDKSHEPPEGIVSKVIDLSKGLNLNQDR